MPAELGTPLDVVLEWEIGPKSDMPGVVLILRHLPLRDLRPGVTLTQTSLILSPDQAELLGDELQKNAALFRPDRNDAH